MTGDNSNFFRKKRIMMIVSSIIRKNLTNEEMCLDASTIFRNITKFTQDTMDAYYEIGFKLIFQLLSKYPENGEMCENLLSLFDKKLSSRSAEVSGFNRLKSENTMLGELETLNKVVAKYKTSKTVARGFASFIITFSFHTEKGK